METGAEAPITIYAAVVERLFFCGPISVRVGPFP
jgi:hypothetical protein